MITSIANTNNGVLSPTQDAFVLKLNPAGNALVYSSFLGGSGTDTGRAIAVDAAGNAFVSPSGPVLDFSTYNPNPKIYEIQGEGHTSPLVGRMSPASMRN